MSRWVKVEFLALVEDDWLPSPSEYGEMANQLGLIFDASYIDGLNIRRAKSGE